jgi:deoxycytidylate deaminase
VYYEARKRALNNGSEFHLAAFTNKGVIGTNSNKCTAKFRKRYKNSPEVHHDIHAEVDLVLRCNEIPSKIRVMRFMKDGTRTMARPCIHCQHFLKHAGVKTVMFTNWEGKWEEMKL